MTALEKLLAQIKAMGIENMEEELPRKTKRKLAKFEKLYNSKSVIHINKKGERNPLVVEELQDLANDILEETEIYMLEKKEKENPPIQEEIQKTEPEKKSFFQELFG
jgi:hypothetical protein